MKETSDELSSLAARVLATGEATPEEILKLAACVLSQDVTPGKRDQPEEKQDAE